MRSRRRGAPQLALPLPTPPRRPARGGKRPGAGRPPTDPVRLRHPSSRPGIAHTPRPRLTRHTPVHVTLRAAPEVASLRRRDGYRAVRWALAIATRRGDFRVCHLSIQSNHVHFIVEAESADALARGMQGTAISIAKQLNRARGRAGRVWGDRYHAIHLTSPRQARNGLAYVLNNWRRHGEDRRAGIPRAALDPFATGRGFDGWRAPPSPRVAAGAELLPVCFPHSWLLTTGWRRHGRIGLGDVPGPR